MTSISTRRLELRVNEFKDNISKEIKKKDGKSDPSRCIEIIEALARDITTCGVDDKTKTTTTAKKSTIKKSRAVSTTVVAAVSLSPSLSSSAEEMMKKSLTSSIRCFRRYKRTATAPEDTALWESAIVSARSLCSRSVAIDDAPPPEARTTLAQHAAGESSTTGSSTTPQQLLPNCSGSYRARLVAHKKEIYKDPPVLPPPSITVCSQTCPFPTRNKKTGELTFVPGNDDNDNDDGSNDELKETLKLFHPNRSPEDILRAGAFGGTYFRPITSSVTNVRYIPKQVLRDSLLPEWIQGLDKSVLTSSTYQKSVNKFGVKCGGSLGMWESSGWISDVDVYGWFQWYCRFYKGRRCSDDVRQIKRWMGLAGPKGRFRSQLCNKILTAGDGGLGKVADVKVSPVIRQTLLHWGIEITEEILVKHGKRVGRL